MAKKPFTKGDPRINRKGRPKLGETLAEKFRDALTESVDGEYTKLDKLIDKAVTLAVGGNVTMLDYVLARGWGKLVDKIELTPKQEFDLTKLSDEELATFMKLRAKLDE